MSHTTELKSIVFTDIDALKAAVAELQKNGVRCTLKTNAKPRAYYSQQTGMEQADYVLELTDSKYDVGFYKDEKLKGYVARTDLFAGSVARVLGAQPMAGESTEQAALGKLYQTYGVHAATRQAAKQGYRVQRVTKPDGTIQLIMSV